MKFAAVLLVSLFSLLQGAVINNPEDELRRTTACLHQSGVSFDSIKKINIGKFDNDPRLKEYLFCVSKNAGFLNEAGELQSEVIRLRLKGGHYSDDTIEEVLQQCTHRMQTPQETAFEFMRCVYSNTFQRTYD